jgi:hypothetical protein
MTQIKYVDGVAIELTPQEITARAAEEAAYAAQVYVPQTITKRQFLIAAAAEGIITSQEALDAAKTGAVPAAIDAVFGALPANERTPARITWASMTIVGRNELLVAAVAAALGKTSQEIDDLFIQAGAI